MGELPEKASDPEGGIGRREFMQGAAATGIVMIGAGYVKPGLKLAGVTRLASAASAPPARIRPRIDNEHENDGEDKDNAHKDNHQSGND